MTVTATPGAAQRDLFAQELPAGWLLRHQWLDHAAQRHLWSELQTILSVAPAVRARTRNGLTSAAMTNCGRVGWWSDLKGYRYEPVNPTTEQPWPDMPLAFDRLIRRVMADTPWPAFAPDACLINFYGPDAKMGLHQDRDERDFSQPIVTVCLGDDADFLIGGAKRTDKARRVVVRSGDVLVMGGESRLSFHGVRKIYPGTSALVGLSGRYSLTFRKAL